MNEREILLHAKSAFKSRILGLKRKRLHHDGRTAEYKRLSVWIKAFEVAISDLEDIALNKGLGEL